MTEQEKAILKEFIDLAGGAAKVPMLMAAAIVELRASNKAYLMRLSAIQMSHGGSDSGVLVQLAEATNDQISLKNSRLRKEIAKLRAESLCHNKKCPAMHEHPLVWCDHQIEPIRVELLAAQKQVLGLRETLEASVQAMGYKHMEDWGPVIQRARQALSAPAPDLSFVKTLVEALEANTGGDLASGEGIYKAEIAREALAATKADRERWGL